MFGQKDDFFVHLAKLNSMELVARYAEISYIKGKLKSDKSELIAIVGRRRVGKTFFVKEVFKDQMFFHFTGLFQSDLTEHMERFGKTLDRYQSEQIPVKTPASWFEAFDYLRLVVERSKIRKKKVIFLDEVPWMATNRSRFLTAFTDFWNGWASARNDIMVIICGSAASWMIRKVLKSKGGLYNRITGLIHLKPFSLGETQNFLHKKGIVVNQKSMIDLYMIFGGIPYYLDQVNMGESVVQAIDRLCFSKSAVMRSEYAELFASLFDMSETHQRIVEALSNHPRGLVRNELIAKSNSASGGGFTRTIEELEQSGFISAYIPFGKKNKDKLFKLTDPYTLFYLKYMKDSQLGTKGVWEKISKSPSWYSWSGLAFENICYLHSEQIKKALKIDGIQSEAGAWHQTGNEEMIGAQIDLLFDRADGVINICEIKYSNESYVITGALAKTMRQRISSFRYFTKTKKAIFPTLITPYELIENKHSIGFIQNVVTMKVLFEAVDDAIKNVGFR